MPIELIRPQSIHKPTTYYSHGADTGDVVYTSGQAPHDDAGAVWDPADLAGHLRRPFVNASRVLETAGTSFGNVVRMTILLRRVEHIELMWEIAIDYLGDNRPAVTVMTVPGLADSKYLIEIDAIAVK
jgi:2-iminobutanoate/2-iminopropanoate deaminase